MIAPISRTISGWMSSVGSSRISSLGPYHQGVADGNLLLTTGEVAAVLAKRFLQHGE